MSQWLRWPGADKGWGRFWKLRWSEVGFEAFRKVLSRVVPQMHQIPSDAVHQMPSNALRQMLHQMPSNALHLMTSNALRQMPSNALHQMPSNAPSDALKCHNMLVGSQLISLVKSPSLLSSVGLDFFINGLSSPPNPVPLVSLVAQTGPQTLGSPLEVSPESALPTKVGPGCLLLLMFLVPFDEIFK